MRWRNAKPAAQSAAPCLLTCPLSTFTFLPAQPARRALSHTKPRRPPRRCNKAHELNAKILVPFILSVIKRQITSCRRHEACLLNFPLLYSRLSGGAARCGLGGEKGGFVARGFSNRREISTLLAGIADCRIRCVSKNILPNPKYFR